MSGDMAGKTSTLSQPSCSAQNGSDSAESDVSHTYSSRNSFSHSTILLDVRSKESLNDESISSLSPESDVFSQDSSEGDGAFAIRVDAKAARPVHNPFLCGDESDLLSEDSMISSLGGYVSPDTEDSFETCQQEVQPETMVPSDLEPSNSLASLSVSDWKMLEPPREEGQSAVPALWLDGASADLLHSQPPCTEDFSNHDGDHGDPEQILEIEKKLEPSIYESDTGFQRNNEMDLEEKDFDIRDSYSEKEQVDKCPSLMLDPLQENGRSDQSADNLASLWLDGASTGSPTSQPRIHDCLNDTFLCHGEHEEIPKNEEKLGSPKYEGDMDFQQIPGMEEGFHFDIQDLFSEREKCPSLIFFPPPSICNEAMFDNVVKSLSLEQLEQDNRNIYNEEIFDHDAKRLSLEQLEQKNRKICDEEIFDNITKSLSLEQLEEENRNETSPDEGLFSESNPSDDLESLESIVNVKIESENSGQEECEKEKSEEGLQIENSPIENSIQNLEFTNLESETSSLLENLSKGFNELISDVESNMWEFKILPTNLPKDPIELKPVVPEVIEPVVRIESSSQNENSMGSGDNKFPANLTIINPDNATGEFEKYLIEGSVELAKKLDCELRCIFLDSPKAPPSASAEEASSETPVPKSVSRMSSARHFLKNSQIKSKHKPNTLPSKPKANVESKKKNEKTIFQLHSKKKDPENISEPIPKGNDELLTKRCDESKVPVQSKEGNLPQCLEDLQERRKIEADFESSCEMLLTENRKSPKRASFRARIASKLFHKKSQEVRSAPEHRSTGIAGRINAFLRRSQREGIVAQRAAEFEALGACSKVDQSAHGEPIPAPTPAMTVANGVTRPSEKEVAPVRNKPPCPPAVMRGKIASARRQFFENLARQNGHSTPPAKEGERFARFCSSARQSREDLARSSPCVAAAVEEAVRRLRPPINAVCSPQPQLSYRRPVAPRPWVTPPRRSHSLGYLETNLDMLPSPPEPQTPAGPESRARSMDYLLDGPPENALRTRNKSEHELRVERSLQNLDLPDWYKPNALPKEGFLLKRRSSGGWHSSSRASSVSSLTSGGGGLTSGRSLIIPKRVTPDWSVPSSTTSPSPRDSPLSRWGSHRQPYLGWRAAAAAAAQNSSPSSGTASPRHSYLQGVYDSQDSDYYRPKPASPPLVWMESSFVGASPSDPTPERPPLKKASITSMEEILDSLLAIPGGSRSSSPTSPRRLTPRGARQSPSPRALTPSDPGLPPSWTTPEGTSQKEDKLPSWPFQENIKGSIPVAEVAPNPKERLSPQFVESSITTRVENNATVERPSSPAAFTMTEDQKILTNAEVHWNGNSFPAFECRWSDEEKTDSEILKPLLDSSSSPDTGKEVEDELKEAATDTGRRRLGQKTTNIKCLRPQCTKTLPVEDARIRFRTCNNCYAYYCSRSCRKQHLPRHREECPHTRTSHLCKQVLMKAREDSVSRRHLSACARRGLLSRGRGVVKLVLTSNDAADYLCSGWGSIRGQTLYVPRSDLLPQEIGHDTYSHIVGLCDKYNPEKKFILLAAIYIGGGDIPTGPGPIADKEIIARGAKLHLSPTLPEDDVKTLILPVMTTPQIESSLLDRQKGVQAIYDQLRPLGVDLPTRYPEIHAKLTAFVHANEVFVPFNIFPIDPKTGRTLMCIILPWADNDIITNISSKTTARPKSSRRKKTAPT